MDPANSGLAEPPRSTATVTTTNRCLHIVAMPYPGRGHINPMMNLCKLLVSKKLPNNKNILITFIITEEWLGFIGSEPKPPNVRFATVPNVIPSELHRADDFPGFLEAVFTKLRAPVEELMDRLEPPVSAIIADPYVMWHVEVGSKRNIPVASLFPMSASVFTVFYNFQLLRQHGHFPADLSERGDEQVDYIPGISRTRLADLPGVFSGAGRMVLEQALECVKWASKGQYFLLTSFYELEPSAIDAIKAQLSIPVYAVGPSIPYLNLAENGYSCPDYLEWLNSQPANSVLYVSLGSFWSVSSALLDEIVAGVCNSGVQFLWVARGEASRIKKACGGLGFVVPWCEQLRVLCHPAIGGFWTHCGWNSAMEGVYAGVPMLTYPLMWDQFPNSKNIVEDWKIGCRVKNGGGDGDLVTREKITELVKKLMDTESKEGKEMKENAKILRESCQRAISKGGSSDTNLDAFVRNISGDM